MKELTERLRSLRTTVELERVFDKKPSTAEFKSSCTVTLIGYSSV